MKKTISRQIIFCAILSLALSGVGLQIANAQTQPAPPPAAVSSNADNSMTPATLPSDIDPNSPLGQVVRMAQSGVDQSTILAYINNSPSPFNVSSDDIIYLNDLGAPTDVVNAMIQRDQQLGVAVNTQPTQTPPPEETEQPAQVDENYFYTSLQPYGGWVNISGYGLCWQPCATIYNTAWQPYCDHGHWVYTDDGWYWMSDYSWGWCTFHYGRWFHDAHHGWCWWPDTAWAPSWVSWRYSSDYCGWAPLPPHCAYREGVGLIFNGKAVGANFDFGIGANFFTFVPAKNFCDPHPDRFRVRPADAAQIFNRTKIVNNFSMNNRIVANDGIPVSHVSTAIGRPVQAVTIQARAAATGFGARGEQLGGNGRTLIVNRPHFNASAPPALNNGVRPHTVPMIPAQPPANRGTQNQNRPAPLIIYGHGNNYTPQNSQPVPRITTQEPQERNNAPTLNLPAPARSYWSMPQTEMPAPNNNSQRYMSPRLQEHTPRVAPQPEERVSPPPQQPEFNTAPREESHPIEQAPPPTHAAPAAQSAPQRSAPSHSAPPSGSRGQQQNRNH